jgi:hypothetical protein
MPCLRLSSITAAISRASIAPPIDQAAPNHHRLAVTLVNRERPAEEACGLSPATRSALGRVGAGDRVLSEELQCAGTESVVRFLDGEGATEPILRRWVLAALSIVLELATQPARCSERERVADLGRVVGLVAAEIGPA